MARFYFAYGSNLLTERLAARCPGARLVGGAWLADHVVAFAKRGWMDGSGKATVLPRPGAVAPGVVYELAEGEFATLDAIEGVGRGCDRIDGVQVGAWRASLYVATAPETGCRPFDWYKALILAGAAQHGLDPAGFASLRAAPHDVDRDATRTGRIAALEALRAAGFHDWESLLA
ncbi:gamma-glutamylcyclotransferase [Halovulum dunhuangense]|uniref:Gamma-glutamylcyclotransferase n=1 Tax=Halovulum dunhuangense TaxID=1505036 RepID=A0A849L2U9_9RHOB|nr:gamma-glutamylcyclotransferase family protein [Halovulum dunhuangense]NNU80688.1 gamma-glutamylcyclotransferase [Halovulum dunhuangense]